MNSQVAGEKQLKKESEKCRLNIRALDDQTQTKAVL